jgi:hypothetical protein
MAAAMTFAKFSGRNFMKRDEAAAPIAILSSVKG